MGETDHAFEDIVASMKRSVAALRQEEVPFLLAGSLAVWAQGGPEKRKDLDFVVKPEDAERALAALEAAGMRPERPPEGWLLKAWDGDIAVDLIFEPRGLEVNDEVIARGRDLHVLAMDVRVMALEDVLHSKLTALDEHSADLSGLIGLARAVREQVDWEEVRRRTESSPFARGFFVILDGLGILPAEAAARSAPAPADAEGRSVAR
ncbi:MAG TPA: nucleotidyltransferase [Thermoleophilaceae bacterium]|nr:nucleotidyltransferase [Thermoleophilaceae bacterium]